VKRQNDNALFQEASQGRALFTVQGGYSDLQWTGVRDYQQEQKRMDATVFLDLPASGTREFVVKLPRRWWNQGSNDCFRCNSRRRGLRPLLLVRLRFEGLAVRVPERS
jgi:hypothetical protein